MPAPVVHPFTLEDRRWFDALIAARESSDPLAAYSFPYHLVWEDMFTYEWVELESHRCLLASNQDGSFLALPPLGPDPCGPAMAWAFAFLSTRNRTPAVSRIENVPEPLAARCREQGDRVVPKGPDYLYRRADLVALRGDRYKGQRVSYNHCVKQSNPSYRPFRPEDKEGCLALYRQWQEGVKADASSDLAPHLAADAESAHRCGITHAGKLGLVGRVAEVEGRLAAYTFGYPLPTSLAPQEGGEGEGSHSIPSPLEGEGKGEGSVFCILFEIADRSVKGLSQFIFREFCRELEPYEFINTMDDSELDGLRRAKLTYHPVRLVESYIVSPA